MAPAAAPAGPGGGMQRERRALARDLLIVQALA